MSFIPLVVVVLAIIIYGISHPVNPSKPVTTIHKEEVVPKFEGKLLDTKDPTNPIIVTESVTPTEEFDDAKAVIGDSKDVITDSKEVIGDSKDSKDSIDPPFYDNLMDRPYIQWPPPFIYPSSVTEVNPRPNFLN